GLHAQPLELLGDPARQATLRDVPLEYLAAFRDRLDERCLGLELVRDQRQHGLGGGALEVAGDRLSIGCLPRMDAVDDDETAAVAEEAERVARRDRVLARGRLREQVLDRLLAEAVAQTAERPGDLRAVAAGQKVRGAKRLWRHGETILRRTPTTAM